MRYLKILITLSVLLLLESCGGAQAVVPASEPAVNAGQESVEAVLPEAPLAQAVSDEAEQPKQEATDIAAGVPEQEESGVSEKKTGMPSSHVDEDEDIPADFFRCELKINHGGEVFQARSFGPTLEEARDNSVDEACAIPCAASVEDGQLSDDEAEARIDACSEACASNADVLAAACWQNEKVVYTEGEWNENGDKAPTNGAEILDVQQVSE